MDDATLAAIREALTPLDAVRVAFVFGSRVSGTARPDSDLDLAVLFARGTDPIARLDAKLAVIDALTAKLGPLGERTDVVDLDDCDPAIAFAALCGRLVLERDRDERLALHVRICRNYEDDAPRRALYRRAAVARWSRE